MERLFSLNSIVSGKYAGKFVVVGYGRSSYTSPDGENWYYLKGLEDGKLNTGQLALPESALKAA